MLSTCLWFRILDFRGTQMAADILLWLSWGSLLNVNSALYAIRMFQKYVYTNKVFLFLRYDFFQMHIVPKLCNEYHYMEILNFWQKPLLNKESK